MTLNAFRFLLLAMGALCALSGHAAVIASSTAGVDVPPALAHQPAAASCHSLRSASYRLITPTFGGLPSDQTSRMTLDAPRLAITRSDGSTGTWVAQGPCRFTDTGENGGSTDYVVSQAGILAGRIAVNGGGSHRLVLGFPEQVHALSALAGTWNLIGLRAGSDGFYADAGSIRFDRQGAITAVTECANPATWSVAGCAEWPAEALADRRPFVADAGGGFVSRSAGSMTRLFLVQAASGPLLLAGIAGDGAIFVGTPPAPTLIPVVGETTSRWNLDITSRLASVTSTYTTRQEILRIDAHRTSSTRRKRTIGLSDEHEETLQVDDPRPGYVTRHRGEAPGPLGTPVRFTEVTTLQFLHLGLTSSVLPGGKLLEISILLPP